MTIAWSAVVVIALLLPGFSFLAGYYFPENVTKESSLISPAGQLALVVFISLFMHLGFYWLINNHLCINGTLGTKCISLPHLFSLLNIQAQETSSYFKESLNKDVVKIIYYFSACSFFSFILGWTAGYHVGRGILGRFTKHAWAISLNNSRNSYFSKDEELKRVTASILSKIGGDGYLVLYSGVVSDHYIKSDGIISHMVLRYPEKGILNTKSRTPALSVRMASIPSARIGSDVSNSFLVITQAEISNVFFEPEASVTVNINSKKILEDGAKLNPKDRIKKSHTESNM